jgi:peptidoglycan/xylan/chitin deacetylase (PgdA/CDA1 family)
MRRRRPIRALRRAVLGLRKRHEPVGVILMYHRIAPGGVDPWQLGVSPVHFDEHLEVIRRTAHPVSLATLVSDVRQRRIKDRCVVVTFDDGFADNLYSAKPLLERAGVPATVYVTTGPIGTPDEFWWDELDHLILLPARLPDELQLSVRGGVRQWTLGRASTGAWAPGARDDAQRARAALHREIWELLLPLAHDEQQHVLDALRRWSQVRYQPRASHRVMRADEIAQLASGGLVDVGAHTVTHPHLPSIPATNWRLEIEGSRRALEPILGHVPSSFSYPYGAVPASISALVRDIGFESAVATHEQNVWRGDDVCRLPRFGVRDWDGAEFERRFTTWLKQYAEP